MLFWTKQGAEVSRSPHDIHAPKRENNSPSAEGLAASATQFYTPTYREAGSSDAAFQHGVSPLP